MILMPCPKWNRAVERPDFVKENIKGMANARAERNITQIMLGKAIVLSDTMISLYECGRCLPGRVSYNKLAEYFGWQKWE